MTASVRIARAQVEPFSVALDTPVESAAGRWDKRAGALLRVYDDEGMCGIGEASPLAGISPESTDEAIATLTELARRLPGLRPPAGANDVCIHQNRLATGVNDVCIHQNRRPWIGGDVCVHRLPPTVVFAFETALLDLYGQISGCDAASIISRGTPVAERVPVCALLDLATSRGDGAGTARALAAKGFDTLKVKIAGHQLDEDLARLADIRAALPAIHIRIDANGTLPAARSEKTLARLAALGVQLAEDPVPHAALSALLPSPVPIAVDLDARARSGDLPAWISAPDVAAVVIKPAVVGGIARTLALAEAAAARGVKTVVSHLMDGPVAMAAYAEIALAIAGRPAGGDMRHAGADSLELACGLGPHAGLTPWRIAPPQHRGATIARSGQPGLGLSS